MVSLLFSPQRTGDNVLATLRAMANSLTELRQGEKDGNSNGFGVKEGSTQDGLMNGAHIVKDEEVVYFDVLGWVMVVYTKTTANFLNAFALLLPSLR